MAKKDNPFLFFRREWWDNLRHKSPELFKETLTLLFSTFFDGKDFDPYFFDEQGSNPSPAEDLAIPMIKITISDREAYIAKCNKLSANAKKQNQLRAIADNCEQLNTIENNCVQLRVNRKEKKGRESNIEKEDKIDIYTSDEVLSSEAEDPPIRQPNFNYSPILEGWNRIGLKQVIKLTDERRHKIRMRDKEISDAGFTWQMVFDKISNSDFLKGQNRNKWQATFDWLVTNKENWLKVMEGNYDNKDGAQQQITSQNLESIRAAIALGGASVKADK